MEVRRAGRPQRPVEPGDGPGQQLALALRKLRKDSGNPSYRAMGERAHYSASALARAASGAALPSRELVLAYVRACGGDEAEWDQRWAAAGDGHDGQERAQPQAPAVAENNPDGQPGHADRQPVRAREPRWGMLRRRSRLTATAAAAAVAATAVLTLEASTLLASGQVHPVPRPAASSANTTAGAGDSTSGGPVPVRRQGVLVLATDQVADLDTPASMAPGWGVVESPGTASDDIWFGDEDHALHGDLNADIVVLPAGRAGTYSECAQEEDYGQTLDASHIRPGVLVCNITSDDRDALLRIVDVRRTAVGIPYQITFDVTVWVPLHKT